MIPNSSFCFLLLHGFSSCTVWSAFPYSRFLVSLFNAYPEIGVNFLCVLCVCYVVFLLILIL